MGKILLYYKYISLDYPHKIKAWQTKLCQELGLKGRILLATEGINGTVGGTTQAIKSYIQAMREHPLFADVDFKESAGGADYFPRMQVLVKDEIVHLGLDKKIFSAADGGIHLSPAQVHDLLSNKPSNLVVLDARNTVESAIGTFTGAITPDIANFRDLPAYLDDHAELLKDKEVLMFCTGGVRCERASAYLKSKGIAKQVYQLEGGIHRYIEQYPEGFFRGKNYVFDNRLAVKVNDDILSSCSICAVPCDEYNNCMNAECNKHFIGCTSCVAQLEEACSATCLELIKNGTVSLRPRRIKMPACTITDDHARAQ